jgi:DNA-binding NtrC family response regulator
MSRHFVPNAVVSEPDFVRASQTLSVDTVVGLDAPGALGSRDAAAPGFFVGEHPSMLRVFDLIRRFARVSDPVLLLGESGTGKELAARALHERSAQADGPFVAVNCGGIPHELIAAELFGHERGAFTGATQRRIGKIEEADGGTLFLDEIGDMPLQLQAHLLRVIQEYRIERVGGTASIPVSFRVVAATNIDLSAAVREGRFRADLYHRLNILSVTMPPLRERVSDINVLTDFFIEKFRRELKQGPCNIPGDTWSALTAYDWPGNVRQLIGALRRGMLVRAGEELTATDLGLPVPSLGSSGLKAGDDDRLPAHHFSLAEVRARMERRLVKRALVRNANLVALAAQDYGVSRGTFYKLMRYHGVDRSSLQHLHQQC